MTHSRKLLLRLLALLVASVMVFLVYTVTLTMAGDGDDTLEKFAIGDGSNDSQPSTTPGGNQPSTTVQFGGLPPEGVGGSELDLDSTTDQNGAGNTDPNNGVGNNQDDGVSSLSSGGSSVGEGGGSEGGLTLSDDEPFNSVTFAYVIGPSRVSTLTDNTATYTFSLQNMSADVLGLEFDYRIEELYFQEKDSLSADGWDIVEETGWASSGGYITKSVFLDKAEGAGDGVDDFFKAVLGFTGECGLTTVEIVNATAVYADESVPLVIAASFQTEISPFSMFDVNEDNTVDLADFASAVYFFTEKAGSESWAVSVAFESDEVGGVLMISPARCDVNDDGIIDLEDLILIRNNYSRDAVQLPKDEVLDENTNDSSGTEDSDNLDGTVEDGDDDEENGEGGLEEPDQGGEEEGNEDEAELDEGLPEDEV